MGHRLTAADPRVRISVTVAEAFLADPPSLAAEDAPATSVGDETDLTFTTDSIGCAVTDVRVASSATAIRREAGVPAVDPPSAAIIDLSAVYVHPTCSREAACAAVCLKQPTALP